MRKFLFLVILSLIFTSCSLGDDDSENFFLEVMPIESIEIPDEFVFGETYEISMTYSVPNDCYHFFDYIYQSEDNQRTIAVVNRVFSNTNCTEMVEQVTVSFDFLVTSTETYIFRFYQGQDDEGEDQYYIVEVPVAE